MVCIVQHGDLETAPQNQARIPTKLDLFSSASDQLVHTLLKNRDPLGILMLARLAKWDASA